MEVTTGPLGQGLGNAVGMAMAARRERGLFDPDAAPGTSPFDHYIYAFASDGDIEEGITHESSSIAGVQELGNLIVLYDDNHISIEDDTNVAKSEDVGARYAAYGWHVQHVDWFTPGGAYEENVEALNDGVRVGQGAVADSRRSSCCARSSAGPRRTRRAPARRTAPPSARPRSRRPRRSSASTRP